MRTIFKLCLFLSLLVVPQAYADIPNIAAGVTGDISQCVNIAVRDTSVTTSWAGLTGLTFATGSLTCTYHRNSASSSTAITLATSTLGTWASGAFKQVDSTLMPGIYQICLPNTAVALGANSVTVTCKGAANMEPANVEISLISGSSFGFDGKLASEATVTLGLASAGVSADDQYNGSLLATYDANGILIAKSCILDTVNSSDTVVTVDDISAFTAVGNNYVIQPDGGCKAILAGTQTFNTTGTLSGSVGSVTGAVGSVTGSVGSVTGAVGSVTGNVGGNVTGSTASVTGNVGGNVTGSVGSVVGAVGSVTGNVGGNVVGSTASVTGNVGGNVTGNVTGTIGGLTAAAVKDFFDTDSTVLYAAAVTGSVVKEIADNAAGGGGGGGDFIISSGTAQSVTASPPKMRLAASATYANNTLNDHAAVLILTSSGNTAAVGQVMCIKTNASSNDEVTFTRAYKSTPSGTVTYAVIPAPNCNPANWPKNL